MKNRLQAVFLLFGLCCVSGVVFAAAIPTFNAPTPKQSYRVVGMEGHDATRKLQPVKSQPVSVNPAPTQSGAVSQLAQESLSYQQKSNQEIQYLANKNNKITSQLTGLTQMISLLSQQIAQIHTVQSQLIAKAAKQARMSQSSSVIWGEWVHWLESIGTVGYVNFGGAALLLMALGFLIGRPNRHAAIAMRADTAETLTPMVDKPIIDATDEDDTRDEYNFMATSQAIPTMLDLARSYIVMGDHDQVRSVLEKVMDRGDKEQQAEAQAMLNEIDQK